MFGRRFRNKQLDIIDKIEAKNREAEGFTSASPDPTGKTPGFLTSMLVFEPVESLEKFQLEYIQAFQKRRNEELRRDAIARYRKLRRHGIKPGVHYGFDEYSERFQFMLSTAEKLAEARYLEEAAAVLRILINLSDVQSANAPADDLHAAKLMFKSEALFAFGNAFVQHDMFRDALASLQQLYEYTKSTKPEALPFIAKELASRHLGLAEAGYDRQNNLIAARDLVMSFEKWTGIDTAAWVLYIRIFAGLKDFETAARGIRKLVPSLRDGEKISGISLAELVAIEFLARLKEPRRFRDHFGPFAASIYAECAKISLTEAWKAVGNTLADLGVPGADGSQSAILMGQVIIYEESHRPSKDNKQIEVMMHEMVHLAARNRTTYRSEGVWYHACRDVPTAALVTYIGRVEEMEKDGIPVPSSLDWLISFGKRSTAETPNSTNGFITNMLEYFETVAEETNATYQCAAIQAGMILELLGDAQSEEVQSYLGHLQIMSHEAALEKARRRVSVEF